VFGFKLSDQCEVKHCTHLPNYRVYHRKIQQLLIFTATKAWSFNKSV